MQAAYPGAGSVYYWSAQMVPAKHSPLASYVCGWALYFGYVAVIAVLSSSLTRFINAALIISNLTPYSDTILAGASIVLVLLWALLNMARIEEMAAINTLVGALNIGTTVTIVMALILLPPVHAPVPAALFNYRNETSINSPYYVIALGLLLSAFGFLEMDTPAVLAEETENAAHEAPRGLLSATLLTGCIGISLIVALILASPDLDAVQHGRTNIEAFNVFDLALDHNWAMALSWLLVANLFFSGMSVVGVSGRILYALARDKGTPAYTFVSNVHSSLHVPVNAICISTVLASLLLCMLFSHGSSVAFSCFVGLAVIGMQASYGTPILLKCIYRPSPMSFPQAPFSLGMLSLPLGLIASLWLFGTAAAGFLPTQYPITLANMNWSIVMFGGYCVLSAANWILHSHKTFTGPPRADDPTIAKRPNKSVQA